MAAMHVLANPANQRIERGVRPFDLGQDLRAVAQLIADAFADELDLQGEAALRELRIMGHMSGLVRLLSRSTGEFQDVFNGFVYIEDGKLVGNVTVQRATSGSGRWQIANVAVDPRYRGRGISRSLMETALDYIRDMGGTWAVLQVRAHNQIARGLYSRMSFEEMGGSVEMRSPRVPKGIGHSPIPGLAPFSTADSTLLYDLANSEQSAESQWWRAIRRSDLEVPLERSIGEWFSRLVGRDRVYRMAIRDFTGRFECALILTARRWQGEHSLQLWARPEARERYEQKLIVWALATLQEYPIWPITATLTTAHTIAQTALEEFGFHAHSTLLTMRRKI
ncbi:MAG: GNAT family N-acetyltransferase [Caldilineaceae bacterium]|nr:GNAT family N-acetyltransferase [Caldilineaceae bacterium]